MIRFSWESDNYLNVQYSGAVTGDELVQASLSLSGDARFDDLRLVLSDWYDIESVSIQEKDVLALVSCNHALAKSNPHLKVAVVTSKNNVAPQLVSFYATESEAGPWITVLFSNKEEANTWLFKHG